MVARLRLTLLGCLAGLLTGLRTAASAAGLNMPLLLPARRLLGVPAAAAALLPPPPPAAAAAPVEPSTASACCMRERFLPPMAAGAVAAAALLLPGPLPAPGPLLVPAAADGGAAGVSAAAMELRRRWKVLLTPPEWPPEAGPPETAAGVARGPFAAACWEGLGVAAGAPAAVADAVLLRALLGLTAAACDASEAAPAADRLGVVLVRCGEAVAAAFEAALLLICACFGVRSCKGCLLFSAGCCCCFLLLPGVKDFA